MVCSDRWRAYLSVVRKQVGRPLRVLDRLHVARKLGEMIDAVRAAAVRELRQRGREPVLQRSRWLLLKCPENLTAKQRPDLATCSSLSRAQMGCLGQDRLSMQSPWRTCRNMAQAPATAQLLLDWPPVPTPG